MTTFLYVYMCLDSQNVPEEFDLSLIDLDTILSINLIDEFLKACILLNRLKKSFLCPESIELQTK